MYSQICMHVQLHVVHNQKFFNHILILYHLPELCPLIRNSLINTNYFRHRHSHNIPQRFVVDRNSSHSTASKLISRFISKTILLKTISQHTAYTCNMALGLKTTHHIPVLTILICPLGEGCYWSFPYSNSCY